MLLDPAALRNVMTVLTAFAAAFVAALWLSLVFWTWRDISTRSRDPLARILAALVVTLLFLPGLLVYFILRPRQTLEEEYQHTLEEEALLQSIEETALCPGCGRHTQTDWVACPTCHTRLRKPCHQCGRLMELPWNLCPFCGSAEPGMHRENLTMDDALRSLPVEEPDSDTV